MKKPIVYVVIALSIHLQALAQVQALRIQQHIKILSNDSLMGRGSGTSGEKMAAHYIKSKFSEFGLKPFGDGGTYLQTFPFKFGIHGTGRDGVATNVIGFIDNNADKTIVVGAHYDHLGLGYDQNSLDANPQDKIHNGADDNASGVAGVLELARYFQHNSITEKNNYLFICFSGEELGLLGSTYFTEHPAVDLNQINYMINLDMIGRLNTATGGLVVSGTGTSAAWEKAIKSISSNGITIKTDSSGVGASDHTSFYLKNIPALHFFTGSHSDYHKPSDDWDKINFTGEVAILNYITKLIEELDDQPKLVFLATKNTSMGSAREFKVTMGIMPSYTSFEEGLRVDGVSEQKPAQKAGIKTGDLIIQVGDLKIKDIQDYMDALGKFEKGQTVNVKVRRGSEVITLPLTF